LKMMQCSSMSHKWQDATSVSSFEVNSSEVNKGTQ
jgi:hypothetical protein